MKNSERSFARRIDLTSLQLFVAVCELGSIGRAAEREYIAASAVSKRLSDLEAAVDTALLYRHSRGVDPHPRRRKPAAPCPQRAVWAGAHARRALGIRRWRARPCARARHHLGHRAVSARRPGRFQQRAPAKSRSTCKSTCRADVLQAVQEGTADIGICNMGQANTNGLQTRPYRTDQLVLVVPQDHALAQRSIDFF